jgi:site-specific DNA-cytosine methylase
MHRAVDCLGFAGGFTLGVVQAGFALVGKRELKGGFGVANCEANRHLLGDGWQAEACDFTQWTMPNGGAELVFGNPPCSGFSVMSTKDFRGADSKVNACMWSFVNYVARVKPVIAIFESVQQARNRPDGLQLMRALRDRLEEDSGLAWDLTHVRHNAYHVGGAAQRRRYFWVASRVPFGIEVETPRRYPLLNDVLSDLHGLTPDWHAQPYRRPPTWWSKERRSDAGTVDGHAGSRSPLSSRILDLIREAGWFPGESIADVCRRAYETFGHLPASFRTTEAKIVSRNFRMGFTTPVRWHGDRPGRVITGGSLEMVIHPVEDRLITHREAARVLGFPDDWLIAPLRGNAGLHATWGKGITVDCGRWIAGWAHAAIDEHPGSYRGTPIGDREWDIDVTHGNPASPGRVVVEKRKPAERNVMSTETVEATSQTEEGVAPTRGPGRGRPDVTVTRDATALEALTEAGVVGLTRDELAAKIAEKTGTDTSSSEAYGSLYRLRRDDQVVRVQRDGKPHWVTKANEADAREAARAADAEAKLARTAAAEARKAEATANAAPTEAPEVPVEDVA